MLIGLLAPFASALYLILESGNAALKKEFFNKLINIRLIKPSSIPLFLILFPASMIVSILISIPLGYSIDQFTIADEFSFTVAAVPTLLFLLLAAIESGGYNPVDIWVLTPDAIHVRPS